MATLQELRGMFKDSDLQEKVEAATVIAANNFLSGSPTSQQKNWAAYVFAEPKIEAKKAVMAVLASNSGLSVAAIQSATDTAIQANVDSVAQTLVDAYAAV
jgi:hypothetical protein